MKFERYRKTREEVKIDVIPVMNLFAILVSLLLLTATFYHIGTIPTYLPWFASTEKADEMKPRSVYVTLLVNSKSIRLTTSQNPEKQNSQNLSLLIGKKHKGYDLETLQNTLYQIKLLYENSDTIVLLPSDTIEYDQIVQILDAAREITFHSGTIEEVTIPLFPVVVFSRKV